MKEGTSKRKEWIKNVAIIFLVVMLALTFFSNTIMNYSLPEVATVYVQSGSITAKIRGTGTVEATDPYSVVAKETRVITSVAVEEGDTVEKDDILYYLEDAESEELIQAEADLNTLQLEYMLALFNGDVTNNTINKVKNGTTDSFSSYQSQISAMQGAVQAAEDNVQAHQAVVDELTKQSELLQNVGEPDTTAEEEAVDEAEDDVASAENAAARATSRIEELQLEIADVEAKVAAAQALVPGLSIDPNDPNSALVSGGIKALEEKEEAASIMTEDAIDAIINIVTDATGQTLSEEDAISEVKNKTLLAGMDDAVVGQYSSEYDEILASYNAAKAALSVAQKEKKDGTSLLQGYSGYLNKLVDLENEISDAMNARSDASREGINAQNDLDEAQDELLDMQDFNPNEASQLDTNRRLIEATAALAAVQLQLETAQADQEDLVKNLQAELNLDYQTELIALKEAEIEALREKSMGAAITAPVAGMVTSVLHVAGESTTPDEEVAVIQVDGKGFTVSFSVTNEQAGKVQVGDMAELQNSWYYQDVQVTLTSIKPDPDNPGKNRLLTFTLSGSDLQAGQSLSLSVGQRSADYEFVVPNSAIREDANGKFILIVEPRNSPLGNRYYATRVDVEELASDDTNTAISGALYGNEYVITTATKPVVAGELIRFND